MLELRLGTSLSVQRGTRNGYPPYAIQRYTCLFPRFFLWCLKRRIPSALSPHPPPSWSPPTHRTSNGSCAGPRARGCFLQTNAPPPADPTLTRTIVTGVVGGGAREGERAGRAQKSARPPACPFSF